MALAQPRESCTGHRLPDLLRAPMSALLRHSGANDSAPEAALMLGLTDHFPAQALVNRVAVHLGVPSLCVQIYREGRAFELTFTHPGVTEACHRCILPHDCDVQFRVWRNWLLQGDHGLAET